MAERLRWLGRVPGCVAAAAGAVGLVLLSPLALAVRTVQRWRRGRQVRIRWRSEAFPGSEARPLRRIDVELDLPAESARSFRERLTDTVVRIAERIREADDVYHFVVRQPELAETVVLPIGPQLQELGERFALHLGQQGLAGRTVVWLTLDRRLALSRVLDPVRYDPEAPGEPERLLAGAPVRWAMATSFVATGAAVIHRMLLYLPAAAAADAEGLLERLRR